VPRQNSRKDLFPFQHIVRLDLYKRSNTILPNIWLFIRNKNKFPVRKFDKLRKRKDDGSFTIDFRARQNISSVIQVNCLPGNTIAHCDFTIPVVF
jgi:hypothetical protein